MIQSRTLSLAIRLVVFTQLTLLVPISATAAATGPTHATSKTATAVSLDRIRLIVRFDSKTTKSKRALIHSSVGGTAKKHFASIHADLVIFNREKGRSPSEEESSSICARYLKSTEVRSCEPDLPVRFPAAMSCELMDSAASKLAAELPEVFSQVSAQACEVVPNRGLVAAQGPKQAGHDGLWRVSPLWAQQVVGADLAQEFVSERLSSGKASRVPTGNIDTISKRPLAAPIMNGALIRNLNPAKDTPLHGDETSNLVSAPRFGASPAVTWSALVSLISQEEFAKPTDDTTGAWNSSIIDALEAMEKTPTRLVTASISYFGSTPQIAVDRFVDGGRVFVQSSGNDYPRPSGDATTRAGHIRVGSVGPNGLPSPFSQEPVKVYAPADAALLSAEDETFGGTSGATPLVSGSIVNALALLPDLSNEEIESLLSKTSLPSFSQNNGGLSAGLLNSYRLAIVAGCMADRETASMERLGSAPPKDCHDQSERASQLRSEADLLLRESTCVGQRDGLKALRASFLLNPTREAALRIAGIYEKLGYPGDARWYRTTAASLGTSEQQAKHFDDLLAEPSLNMNRYFNGSAFGVRSKGIYALSLASRLPPEHPLVRSALAHVESLAKSSDPATQNQAIEQAAIIGPRALPTVTHLFVGGDKFSDPRHAVRAISKLTAHKNKWEITPWIEQTEIHFRGTPFESHLPQSGPSSR